MAFSSKQDWIQEFQHHDILRHGGFIQGRFIAKFLPKIPGGQTIRALYGALGNVSSGSGNFVDPGIGPGGSIMGLNDDDGFSVWLSITKHLQQPHGIAFILHRNCPLDLSTLGQHPHLDQAGLLPQDLL